MTHPRPFFHARLSDGDPGEGLAVSLAPGGVNVSVVIGRRSQSVTLASRDALDLAEALRRRLARNDRLRPVREMGT